MPEYLKQEAPRHSQHLLAQVCHLKHEILCDNSFFFFLFDELAEEFLRHILFSQRRQQKQRTKLFSHAKNWKTPFQPSYALNTTQKHCLSSSLPIITCRIVA